LAALLAQARQHRDVSAFLTGARGTLSSEQYELLAGMDELSARRYAHWQAELETRLRDESSEHERLWHALESAVSQYQSVEGQTKKSFDD